MFVAVADGSVNSKRVKFTDKKEMLRHFHFQLVITLDFTGSMLPEVLREIGLLTDQNYQQLEV